MKNHILKSFIILTMSSLFFTACNNDDDEMVPTVSKATFKVTVENILESKSFLQSGTTGFLAPGESEEITFHAGQGHALSFATMFVQSNDLFYAPSPEGIALYDADGNAITGDITAQVDLWDAGTEVNQEPGVGADQAPRQSGANTGATENGTVELIENVNDGYTYPSVEEIIRFSLTHNGGTEFTLSIENISGSSTLPSPVAPGVWAVHDNSVQLFTEGATAPEGLEGVAEDGDNALLAANLDSATGLVSPFAPGVFVIHEAGQTPLFEEGVADKGEGLEALAEDGDPGVLNSSLSTRNDLSVIGVFNTPAGSADPGPLFPGSAYEFTFEAEEGDYLNLATMLVQSNDLFYAYDEGGIALFNNGSPLSGDITTGISLWDAGTEVNEFPGAGANQPVRGGGNSGPAENGTVRLVDDGYSYPSVAETVKITIEVQ